jgi:MoaA/NifB/PqqE/SkfB family radical SAM enzyme
MEIWGKTLEENPDRCPTGPIIADIELSKKCNFGCSYCYKATNKAPEKGMTLEEFKTILPKLGNQLTQIAFGVDSNLSQTPNAIDIMRYTYSQGITPNITLVDVNKELADTLVNNVKVGAVSISLHLLNKSKPKDIYYNSIKALTDVGLKQTNAHFVLSKNTLPLLDEVLKDIKTDKRLEKLNALVILSLKQKGRGVNDNPVSKEEFAEVLTKLQKAKINFGFDSCSVGKLNTITRQYDDVTESCESFAGSLYINEKGIVSPGSFLENEPVYKNHNLLNDSIKTNEDFINKVWNHQSSITFCNTANKCVNKGEGCQHYKI